MTDGEVSFEIRKMTESDIDEAVRIITAHEPTDGDCAARYYAEYFGDPERTASADEEPLVAVEETGCVVGMCGFQPDAYFTPGIYWVSWFYVDAACRGRGVGSALLQRVVESVSAFGARKLFVDTSSDPIYGVAVELYERFGFQVEGVLTDYYQEGEDSLFLGKRL
jgi:ribosomal protein S18 acetylase RimI-like enzyme